MIVRWNGVIWTYAIGWLLSIVGAAVIHIVLVRHMGQSMDWDLLHQGLQRTLLGDLINNGVLADAILPICMLLGVGFLLPSTTWLIIDQVNPKLKSIEFLKIAVKYILPFSLINLIYLMLILTIGGVMFGLYFLMLGNPLENTTELPFLYSFIIMVLILGYLSALLWSACQYSKLSYYRGKSLMKSIGFGIGKLRNKRSLFLAFIAFIIMIAAITMMACLQQLPSNGKIGLVLVFYMLMQTIVFLKILAKQWLVSLFGNEIS